MRSVHGETDSERFFALITRRSSATATSAQAIARAASWVAENLPVFALNLILITAAELWALRYPDVHELYVLERAAGGPSGGRHLEHASARGLGPRARRRPAPTARAVVVASERDGRGSRAGARSQSGELLHVDADLRVRSTMAAGSRRRRTS